MSMPNSADRQRTVETVRGRQGHRCNEQADLRGESAIATAHAPAICIAFIVLTNPNTFITRLRL
jgi:hypothetical protein